MSETKPQQRSLRVNVQKHSAPQQPAVPAPAPVVASAPLTIPGETLSKKALKKRAQQEQERQKKLQAEQAKAQAEAQALALQQQSLQGHQNNQQPQRSEAELKYKEQIEACVMELVAIQEVLWKKDIVRNTHQLEIERARDMLVTLEFEQLALLNKTRETHVTKSKENLELQQSYHDEAEKMRMKLAALGKIDGGQNLRITDNLEHNYQELDSKINELETRVGRADFGPGMTEKKALAAISELQRSRPLFLEYDALAKRKFKVGSKDKMSIERSDMDIIKLRLQQATLLERIRESLKGLDENRRDLPQIMTQRYGKFVEIKRLAGLIREERQKIADARAEAFRLSQKKRQDEILQGLKKEQEEILQNRQRREERNLREEMKEVVIPCGEEVDASTILINYVTQFINQKSKKLSYDVETLKMFEAVGVRAPMSPEAFPEALIALKQQKAKFLQQMNAGLVAKKAQKDTHLQNVQKALNEALEEAKSMKQDDKIQATVAQARAFVASQQQGARQGQPKAAAVPATPALPHVYAAAVASEQAQLQVKLLEVEVANRSKELQELTAVLEKEEKAKEEKEKEKEKEKAKEEKVEKVEEIKKETTEGVQDEKQQ